MTVDIYGHLLPDQDRGAVNFLDGVFGQDGQANRSSTNKKSTVTSEDYDAFNLMVKAGATQIANKTMITCS